jgi:1-acyl-sn-glycerol-3-phosphate acyltransferase
MLRYVVLDAFIGIFSILMCIWALVIPIFGGSGRAVHFGCAVPWSKVILRVCGIRVTVRGLENVNPEIPRIYMSNHQSFFDIWTILAFLPVDFKFILKQELMKIPLLGPAMTRAGYIGIERKDPEKRSKALLWRHSESETAPRCSFSLKAPEARTAACSPSNAAASTWPLNPAVISYP